MTSQPAPSMRPGPPRWNMPNEPALLSYPSGVIFGPRFDSSTGVVSWDPGI